MSDREQTSETDGRKEQGFDFMEMLQQETKMSIILILKTYQSLNLRQISTVLGISEPSTHAHIMELYEKNIIELDVSMADKRGKYYCLAPEINDLLEREEQEFDNRREEGTPQHYTNMAVALRSLALMSQRFGMFAAKYLEERANELSRTYQEKQKMGEEGATILSGQLTFVNVANQEEFEEILTAFKTYTNKVSEINQRNSDLSQKDAYESIMVSGLVLPLLKLDPRK